MLKQILHKLCSIAMTLLLLLSTVSFTVEKHFCGDVLIDVAVFTDLEKCASDNIESKHEEIKFMHCCKDTLETLQGQKELTVKTFDDLELDQQLFLASYLYSYTGLFQVLEKQTNPHRDYNPPKLIADIHVLDQVFLI
ncbi:HYC_CC_PP family protein [Psychroserpens damuponensis]|uniref:HYC_CC_PP family protein n=1 Tax=Psychroserpens damuponensis TaxID=943936 RepID=UPI000B2F0818|nr:hypothetical protein [Psychroserpens damuponensis]